MVQADVTPGRMQRPAHPFRSSTGRDSHQPSGTAALIRCQASTSCTSSSQAQGDRRHRRRRSDPVRARRRGSAQAADRDDCQPGEITGPFRTEPFKARKATLRHQSIRRRGRSAISITSIQACTVGRAAPNARTASPQGESARTVASGSIDHVSSDNSLERSAICSRRLRLAPSRTRQSQDASGNTSRISRPGRLTQTAVSASSSTVPAAGNIAAAVRAQWPSRQNQDSRRCQQTTRC